MINIEKEDKVRAVINVKNLKNEDYINNNYLVMCTKKGVIKKTTLEAFSRPRQAGIIAISINEGDSLLDVKLTSGNDQIMIAKKSGRAVRFDENQVRPMGRNAAGVRAITLEDANDEVVGMVCVSDPTASNLLVISERGYGKKSSIEDYRITSRGTKGVITLNITEKTGSVVGIVDVKDSDEIMIINKSGILIRMKVADLRVMGRNTQGVKLIRLNDDDEISSIAKIDVSDVEEDESPMDSQVDNHITNGDTAAQETPEANNETPE
jgi:DNA gyrase subunit A